MKRENDVAVILVNFPFHPKTPKEGQAFAEMFGIDPDNTSGRNACMNGQMDAEHLPSGTSTQIFNTGLTQEMGKWVDTQDEGEETHGASYRAYLVDDRDVGDVDVLEEISEALCASTGPGPAR